MAYYPDLTLIALHRELISLTHEGKIRYRGWDDAQGTPTLNDLVDINNLSDDDVQDRGQTIYNIGYVQNSQFGNNNTQNIFEKIDQVKPYMDQLDSLHELEEIIAQMPGDQVKELRAVIGSVDNEGKFNDKESLGFFSNHPKIKKCLDSISDLAFRYSAEVSIAYLRSKFPGII